MGRSRTRTRKKKRRRKKKKKQQQEEQQQQQQQEDWKSLQIHLEFLEEQQKKEAKQQIQYNEYQQQQDYMQKLTQQTIQQTLGRDGKIQPSSNGSPPSETMGVRKQIIQTNNNNNNKNKSNNNNNKTTTTTTTTNDEEDRITTTHHHNLPMAFMNYPYHQNTTTTTTTAQHHHHHHYHHHHHIPQQQQMPSQQLQQLQQQQSQQQKSNNTLQQQQQHDEDYQRVQHPTTLIKHQQQFPEYLEVMKHLPNQQQQSQQQQQHTTRKNNNKKEQEQQQHTTSTETNPKVSPQQETTHRSPTVKYSLLTVRDAALIDQASQLAKSVIWITNDKSTKKYKGVTKRFDNEKTREWITRHEVQSYETLLAKGAITAPSTKTTRSSIHSSSSSSSSTTPSTPTTTTSPTTTTTTDLNGKPYTLLMKPHQEHRRSITDNMVDYHHPNALTSMKKKCNIMTVRDPSLIDDAKQLARLVIWITNDKNKKFKGVTKRFDNERTLAWIREHQVPSYESTLVLENSSSTSFVPTSTSSSSSSSKKVYSLLTVRNPAFIHDARQYARSVIWITNDTSNKKYKGVTKRYDNEKTSQWIETHRVPAFENEFPSKAKKRF